MLNSVSSRTTPRFFSNSDEKDVKFANHLLRASALNHEHFANDFAPSGQPAGGHVTQTGLEPRPQLRVRLWAEAESHQTDEQVVKELGNKDDA